MKRSFDLVVIGTGSAGAAVAHRCRKAGWEVAVVDSRPYGGTCALRGCDPKKVLVGAAEVVDRRRRMEGRGVAGDIRIAWPELMAFKRSFTAPVPEARERSYAEAGIERFHGRARFVGPTSLRVAEDTLAAERVLVAAGARPAPLGIPGEDHLTTSTEFLELERLPERIAFVGGGYISFEFAHVAARAGVAVRILHGGDRPLEGFEPELVDRLVEATREVGIEVELNARVEAVERGDAGFRVATGGEGAASCGADLVVHGAGRVPEIDDLDLEAAERGLDFDVRTEDTAGWYSSRRVGEAHAAYKVLVERDSGRILGAHLLGPHAEEAINLFALALREGIAAQRLRSMPWAYPTVASDVSYMV